MTSLDKEKPSSSSSSGSGIHTPSSSPPPSPYFSALHPSAPPTPTQQQTLKALAAIYPVTIIIGGIFSLISPTGHAKNYFSQKHNVFNLLFVKVGWFWTTAAFGVHLIRLRQRNLRVKALMRWGVATVFWIFITQWFFGPPLMDRTFTLTGGVCQPNHNGFYTAGGNKGTPAGDVEEVFTSAACKVAGGIWKGGHDLSGHVFMLTHASMFLWAEIMPKLLDPNKRLANNDEWMGVHWFVWMVLGLWWWMLLMTSVYFHTWQEKLTGWIISLIEWGVIYAWAIPQHEQVRTTIGVPGI